MRYTCGVKTAVIIHGYDDRSEFEDGTRPAASNDHWIPWLQRQLLLRGIETQTPEMPGFHKPNYQQWKSMLERFSPDEETILIGHSCGGGFLVRWLSEERRKVGKVVLVAPWLDPRHLIDPEFFQFVVDQDIASRTEGLTIMYSTDDAPDILESVEHLRSHIKNATFKEFHDKGHFCLQDLKTTECPEVLEEALSGSL